MDQVGNILTYTLKVHSVGVMEIEWEDNGDLG